MFMRLPVNTTVSVELKELVKNQKINFHEALEFGIKFLIADKDGGLIYEYPENNLSNKLRNTLNRLNEQTEKIEKLENLKLKITPADELEPTSEDVFEAKLSKNGQ